VLTSNVRRVALRKKKRKKTDYWHPAGWNHNYWPHKHSSRPMSAQEAQRMESLVGTGRRSIPAKVRSHFIEFVLLRPRPAAALCVLRSGPVRPFSCGPARLLLLLCVFSGPVQPSSRGPRIACALSVFSGDEWATAAAALRQVSIFWPSPVTSSHQVRPSPPSLSFLLCETEYPNPSLIYL